MKRLFFVILCAFWLSVNFTMAESVENMTNFDNSNKNISNTNKKLFEQYVNECEQNLTKDSCFWLGSYFNLLARNLSL
ncbi:hypothetical protein OFO12_04090 [Campylobacter sp. JMF_04 NA10]|uniref:hypothetical protein n=1 Tax=Campylobacter sp. JMF_04 NA10 TaxID=2983824 RepID=UPI0022E9DF39|nr:hypothetical protein [Campylobacter sp. JMF_04 NA10]MDA3076551.1 hypothetical protein [Campylobacter sp. JMF_04 NA10]